MESPEILDEIKRLAVAGMFSDDDLLAKLVLKGGNLLDLVYGVSTRASIDIDFSMDGDFDGPFEDFRDKIQQALSRTYRDAGYDVFDVNVRAVPPNLSDDMRSFWGGYKIDFKVAATDKVEKYLNDIDTLRKAALRLGKRDSTKFLIDISKHEYCDGKEMADVNGYTIFTYTPPMFVCEKLRAICQQMPDYVKIVKSRPSARARDFVDINVVSEKYSIDFSGATFHELVVKIFEIKRVPLRLLHAIGDFRDFHRQDFPAVRDTVKPNVTLEDFDFYFDYVVRHCRELESLWNE